GRAEFAGFLLFALDAFRAHAGPGTLRIAGHGTAWSRQPAISLCARPSRCDCQIRTFSRAQCCAGAGFQAGGSRVPELGTTFLTLRWCFLQLAWLQTACTLATQQTEYADAARSVVEGVSRSNGGATAAKIMGDRAAGGPRAVRCLHAGGWAEGGADRENPEPLHSR